MTENNEDEKEQRSRPRLRIEDGKLWERDDQGDWVEAVSPHRASEDPEIDQLWNMSPNDVERIAKDVADPLHEKAKQVRAEAMEPIVSAMQAMIFPARQQFDDAAAKIMSGLQSPYSIQPLLDQIQRNLTRNLAQPWEALLNPGSRSIREEKQALEEQPDVAEVDEIGEGLDCNIDEQSLEIANDREAVAADYSMNDVYLVLEYMAVAQDDGNAERTRMRQENLDAAVDASDWAQRAHEQAQSSGKSAKAAAWWAGLSFFVGVASALITVFGWRV